MNEIKIRLNIQEIHLRRISNFYRRAYLVRELSKENLHIYFQHIREKYNSIYKVQMPKVTPHVCRHTFCSNMAKSGMNPKTLQYIMGHSDIGVTLNTYTHVQYEDAKKEMQNVCELKTKRKSAM